MCELVNLLNGATLDETGQITALQMIEWFQNGLFNGQVHL